jgi:osmotically-inducible protein OsmY
VGFAFTPQVSPEIGQSVRSSLERIPYFGQTSSIRATIKESVVILEGAVATTHDAMLAVQMAAMEPGVVRVDNRLTIASPAPTAPDASR